jgi:hypothetical protein
MMAVVSRPSDHAWGAPVAGDWEHNTTIVADYFTTLAERGDRFYNRTYQLYFATSGNLDICPTPSTSLM